MKETKEYTYQAYISYCPADKDEAEWLKKALDFYANSDKRARQYPNCTNHSLFFLADDEACSTSWGDPFSKALYSSKYLIAVCSKNYAKHNRKGREIELFCMFNKPENVFLFIVDGEPDSDDFSKECLPEILLNRHTKSKFIGSSRMARIDLRAEGRGNVLRRLCSSIFGIKNVEISTDKEAEQTSCPSTLDINDPISIDSFKTCDCGATLMEGASYCHVCGNSVKTMLERQNEKRRLGEIPLYQHKLHTPTGDKKLEVWCRDITDFPEQLDILTVSAFKGNYETYTKTVIGALYRNCQIDTGVYAEKPFLDLTKTNLGCWISERISSSTKAESIKRLGCIELDGFFTTEEDILQRIRGYCHLLDLAALTDEVDMETVAIPIVGTGNQGIDVKQILIPLSNEIIALLKRNQKIQKIVFVEMNYEKAKLVAQTLKSSYQLMHEENRPASKRSRQDKYVFVSYTNQGDREVAELICSILDEKNIEHFFAPDIKDGTWPEEIVKAIDKCSHFFCIISARSMNSQHVLNELNLAYQHFIDGEISILPFLVENKELSGAFRYYLSTIQNHKGIPPETEAKARELISKIFGDGGNQPNH